MTYLNSAILKPSQVSAGRESFHLSVRHSAGDVPCSFRGMDRASGEPVLLKAYALDEGDDDAAWRKHEAEIDALLALPRHEAVAAPRSIVTATWAPVHEIDTGS